MDSLSPESYQLPIGPLLEVGAELCVHVLSIYCSFVWFWLCVAFLCYLNWCGLICRAALLCHLSSSSL